MEYELKISESKKFIIAKVFVNVTAKLSAKMALEADKIGMENNINRMLFDVRNCRNLEQIKPLYDFAFHDLPDPEKHWFKRVANLADLRDTSHSFTVAFLFSRGFNVKEFFNEEKAISWLEKD